MAKSAPGKAKIAYINRFIDSFPFKIRIRAGKPAARTARLLSFAHQVSLI